MTRLGRMSWILWRGKGYVFILMESKWSRLRMISTVTCGKDCYQFHISWLGGCRRHSTWELFRQCLPKALISWCYTESARVLRHCRSDLCCVLGHHQFNTYVFCGAIVLLCTKSTSCGFSAGGTCWQYTSITSWLNSLERRPTPPEGAVCQTSEGLGNSQELDWWNRRAGLTWKLSRFGSPLYELVSEALHLGKGLWPMTIA